MLALLLDDVLPKQEAMTDRARHRLLPRLRPSQTLELLRAGGPSGEEQHERYLTDGTNLYRFVGWAGGRRLAELEDCRSFELLVVSARQLFGQRLRPVAPAADVL